MSKRGFLSIVVFSALGLYMEKFQVCMVWRLKRMELNGNNPTCKGGSGGQILAGLSSACRVPGRAVPSF